MRIQRTTGAIFGAIVYGGIALITLLLDPLLLEELAGPCAGFFGLLALWMFADYHATKRRERKRLEEFTLSLMQPPRADSGRRLGVAQGDPTRQQSPVEDAELTRRFMQDRADIERLLGVAQSDPNEQLSLVEIAEQVHKLCVTYRLAAEEEALGNPAKLAEITKQIQDRKNGAD